MGLSIHYQGKIKRVDLISNLTDEVIDICNASQWKYDLLNNEVLDGICFGPENCEPLFLTFLKDGTLVCPISLKHKIEPITFVSVKTQFAGMDAHIAIIKLFKYLEQKYFSTFELIDEGGYWENLDEEVLKEQFAKYELALNTIANALENFKVQPGDSAESIADKLEGFLKK